jgi:hypothetical protein
MIRPKARHDVFAGLDFAPAEAENLRIRSAMMRALVAFVRKEDLTQACPWSFYIISGGSGTNHS